MSAGVTKNASKKLVVARVATFKTLKEKFMSAIGMIAKSTGEADAFGRTGLLIPELR